MPLLEEDISRIEALGYKRSFFVRILNGYKILKNRNGKCVFLKKGKCSIYEHRPVGCRLYPVVIDVETFEPLIDDECPNYNYFQKTLSNKKIVLEIKKVAKKLLEEKNSREREE